MKKIFGVYIWSKGTKVGPKTSFFCHFLKFSSLVFLEIAYNDSLQQFLTCSRGNIHEKNLGGAKIGPKASFFYHFLKFGSLVFLEIAYNYSLQQGLT